MAQEDKKKRDNLTVNRRASHDYFVLEKYEAGIELVGTEVKVVRNGEAGLSGSYASVKDGQLYLNQVRIPPYAFGNRFNHEALRTRRLLMHKREIRKLQASSEQKGLSLIPLRIYLTPKGKSMNTLRFVTFGRLHLGLKHVWLPCCQSIWISKRKL